MENTILLTNNDMMIDILSAFLYLNVILNVLYSCVKAYQRDISFSVGEFVVMAFSVVIAIIFIYQTALQFDRGGRSGVPRLWDVINYLSSMALLVSVTLITRYRSVNMGDEHPRLNKLT